VGTSQAGLRRDPRVGGRTAGLRGKPVGGGGPFRHRRHVQRGCFGAALGRACRRPIRGHRHQVPARLAVNGGSTPGCAGPEPGSTPAQRHRPLSAPLLASIGYGTGTVCGRGLRHRCRTNNRSTRGPAPLPDSAARRGCAVAAQPSGKAATTSPSYLRAAEVADILHVSPKTVSPLGQGRQAPLPEDPGRPPPLPRSRDPPAGRGTPRGEDSLRRSSPFSRPLGPPRWVSNAMAAVQTWRYNIVAAARPTTDRDNGQQPGRGCGTSGGVGAAPGAQEESAGGSMWRRGMRLGPVATCGPTAGRRSRLRTWTGSWRPGGEAPRPATSRLGPCRLHRPRAARPAGRGV
jgi:hypothetical protein